MVDVQGSKLTKKDEKERFKAFKNREEEFFGGKCWLKSTGGILTLGLTDIGFQGLGLIQSIEFSEVGDEVLEGDVVVKIDGTLGCIEVLSPATGVIFEKNEVLQAEPDRLGEDLIDEGWLVRLEGPLNDQLTSSSFLENKQGAHE